MKKHLLTGFIAFALPVFWLAGLLIGYTTPNAWIAGVLFGLAGAMIGGIAWKLDNGYTLDWIEDAK